VNINFELLTVAFPIAFFQALGRLEEKYEPNSRPTQLFIKTNLHQWRQHVSALISEPSSGLNNNDNNSNFTLPNIVSNKRLDKSYLVLQLAKIVPTNVLIPVSWQGIQKCGPYEEAKQRGLWKNLREKYLDARH
jgi:hypothetical protein